MEARAIPMASPERGPAVRAEKADPLSELVLRPVRMPTWLERAVPVLWCSASGQMSDRRRALQSVPRQGWAGEDLQACLLHRQLVVQQVGK